ncbi:MAG: glycosyltransferase [Blautia hansenii]|uniref:Glycosyltransferase Gtf1 n=1 Tax=Blautia hansenii TaxID=1322 RepID=A0A6N2RG37_BLAHA
MNVLLVVNYQREIPPFMITEIKYAEKEFNYIEYINPHLDNDNSCEIESTNVIFTEAKKKRLNVYINTFWGLFRKEVRKDVLEAIKTRKFGIQFILHLLKEIYPSEVVFQILKKRMDMKYSDDNVCVLSAWFNSNAYAVARLKRRYPQIEAVSYAHAFEVNPERGPFIKLSMNDYKHTFLDNVYFISKNVMMSYLNELGYKDQIFLNRINVHYLGTINRDSYSKKENSKVFHLLSCSGMSHVKRIELILKMLENWKFGSILWTHIGCGPLWEEIKQQSINIESENPNVKINLLGKLTNREVHEFYRKNSIDLFINVSKSEGLPVSIMEAISYGVPVIATDVGGTSEIVNDKTGFLISSNPNIREIEKIIKNYIELPRDKKELLKKNAKTFWEEKFDADKNGPMFYKNLLKNLK